MSMDRRTKLRRALATRRTAGKMLLVAATFAGGGLFTLSSVVAAAPPTSPGTYGTAAPNAQCGTGAASGAFNARNTVYGPNSRAFGQSGGAGGGAAGTSNSAVCGSAPT